MEAASSLREALAVSDYRTAVGDLGERRRVFVEEDEVNRAGLYVTLEVDQRDVMTSARDQLSPQDICDRYPGVAWWPLRDEGAWGAAAEAALHDESAR
jgi:hypothetical protein